VMLAEMGGRGTGELYRLDLTGRLS